MNIWEPRYEQMPRPELEQLQLKRLKEQVQSVYEKVPFYQDRFLQAGVTPDDINSLDDIAKLPFTSKDDVRNNYPLGLLAVPLSQVVRVHASSGTTGKPIVAPYNRNDLDTWSNLMARSLVAAGVESGDIMQNSYGYGLFTGGLGFHYGAERLGATVIPASAGNTKRQLMLIEDLGTTVLACTPSYTLVIADTAQEMGVDLASTGLRLAMCGAEPWTNSMRTEIESRLGLTAIDFYGLTELIGPGVSCECPYQQGLHIWEDHFLAEIVDPQTGHPLPSGSQGELVLTTLTKEAMPMIRFRTHDLVTLYPDVCQCGRTMTRMSKVHGRTDDMLIVRGVNIFPTQVESVLLSVDGLSPHYQIVIDREHHHDNIEIWSETSDQSLNDNQPALRGLGEKVHREMSSVLGISVKIKLVKPGTITRTVGKARRVIDRRELWS
ncbi:MAG: phenylacetate--CoA ligase [Dehalococcoidales bacterium]